MAVSRSVSRSGFIAGACLVAWLAPVWPGPVAAQPAPSIAPGAVMDHVRVLTRDIGARPANSRAARLAAEYIVKTLTGMGVSIHRAPVGTVDLPAISVGPMRFFRARRRTFHDDNLWVVIQPTDTARSRSLLIMAHYDTVSRSPGAADNAVAVGIALELVRSLSAHPPARTVIVAFTAAEEQRLAGAHILAKNLARDVALAVSLDLVGGPGTLTINGASALLGSAWLRYLARVAARADVTVEAPIPHRVISRHLPQIERSDHGPFTRAGVPALHLYTRAPDAVYLPYHTHLDTEERIASSSVANAARLIETLARTAEPWPQSGGDQGIWFPGSTWTIAGWLLWALCLGLIGALVAALWRLARTRSRTRGLGLTWVLVAYVAGWMPVALVCWLHGQLSAHPMPWVHAPGRVVPLALVMGGTGCAALLMLLSRWRSPAGENRYLIAALVSYLSVGVALLVLDTPELACVPLAMAGLSCLLAHTRRWPLVFGIFVLTLLPLTWPLSPDFLREAVYNGFFRREMPLSAVLAGFAAPATCTAVYVCKRLGPAPYPRARLAVTAILVALAGCAILMHRPTCTGPQFSSYNLTCELPMLQSP